MSDMTELTLVIGLRQHIGGDAGLIESERRLSAEISAATAVTAPPRGSSSGFIRGEHPRRPRRQQLRRTGSARRRLVLAGTVAAALVTAIAVTIALNQPSEPPPWAAGPPVPSWIGTSPGFGPARTEAQLLDYSSRTAAATRAFTPGPHDWVYAKVESAQSSAGSGGFLFGPPDGRVTGVGWIRVDHLEYAGVYAGGRIASDVIRHGRLYFTPGGPGFDLGGWKSVSYRYLSSLPTDPAKLAAVIAAGNRPWGPDGRSAAIFGAITTLLYGQGSEGVLVPPALSANLYRVLSELPGVRFDPTTDLAGRPGIGFSMVTDGWEKQEIVINPSTYAYMGDLFVAVSAHTDVGSDGTRFIKKGQVLGWTAALKYGVVQRAGQVPS